MSHPDETVQVTIPPVLRVGRQHPNAAGRAARFRHGRGQLLVPASHHHGPSPGSPPKLKSNEGGEHPGLESGPAGGGQSLLRILVLTPEPKDRDHGIGAGAPHAPAASGSRPPGQAPSIRRQEHGSAAEGGPGTARSAAPCVSETGGWKVHIGTRVCAPSSRTGQDQVGSSRTL